MLPKILNTIRIIWMNSDHYKSRERLTGLLRKVGFTVLQSNFIVQRRNIPRKTGNMYCTYWIYSKTGIFRESFCSLYYRGVHTLYMYIYIVLFCCGEWISKSAQLLEEHCILIETSSGLQEWFIVLLQQYGQRLTTLIRQHQRMRVIRWCCLMSLVNLWPYETGL